MPNASSAHRWAVGRAFEAQLEERLRGSGLYVTRHGVEYLVPDQAMRQSISAQGFPLRYSPDFLVMHPDSGRVVAIEAKGAQFQELPRGHFHKCAAPHFDALAPWASYQGFPVLFVFSDLQAISRERMARFAQRYDDPAILNRTAEFHSDGQAFYEVHCSYCTPLTTLITRGFQ